MIEVKEKLLRRRLTFWGMLNNAPETHAIMTYASECVNERVLVLEFLLCIRREYLKMLVMWLAWNTRAALFFLHRPTIEVANGMQYANIYLDRNVRWETLARETDLEYDARDG